MYFNVYLYIFIILFSCLFIILSSNAESLLHNLVVHVRILAFDELDSLFLLLFFSKYKKKLASLHTKLCINIK